MTPSDSAADCQASPIPTASVVQTMSGGISLGAYNHIEQIGDLVAGSKTTFVIYTGPAQALNDQARFSLEQAYRSEVAARYAKWKTRYASLPIQTVSTTLSGSLSPSLTIHYEREDLTFEVLRRTSADPATDSPSNQAPSLVRHSFTDLRDGLRHFGDLLLLGPPGGGKTTALWRLALDLVEQGLRGDRAVPLPIFVRLGGLKEGQTLGDLLQAELSSAAMEDSNGRRFSVPAHRTLAPLLPNLLEAGRLVLLWDGLNETPHTMFASTAQALDEFRRVHPGRLEGSRNQTIITCRTDDYGLLIEQCDGRNPLPVQQATIQGLDASTIREVVLTRLGTAAGQRLLEAIGEPQYQALATMARTPLLLTMLCEIYDANGVLPSNRSKLLQAFVARRWDWEQQRHPDTWVAVDLQEHALARLGYMMTEDQSGGTVVSWESARSYLAGGTASPDQIRMFAVGADFLETLNDGQAIRFSHQLIQEYFAAQELQRKLIMAIRLRETPVIGWFGQRRLNHYAAPGKRTGWEETLLLLAGLEGETGHARSLIRIFLTQPLRAAQLLLAGGNAVDPVLLAEVRQAALDQITNQRRTPHERIEAARALALVGDPRFPVTLDTWRNELVGRTEQFGASKGYWCYVPPGIYHTGGWWQGTPSATIELPRFWIARFPVTVAQYAPFVAAGYGANAEHWWTPEGWKWKQQEDKKQPWGWNEPQYMSSNQPVISVTWYETTAWCAWLTEQLAGVLPLDYVIRLPTEAEWEVAATYDAHGERQIYAWGAETPTLNHAIYAAHELNAATPVGCCPAGTAACGALDMAGNVWEWATSDYDLYPTQSAAEVKDFTLYALVPSRGGSFYSDSSDLRCRARGGAQPDTLGDVDGFRVVVAPRFAH